MVFYKAFNFFYNKKKEVNWTGWIGLLFYNEKLGFDVLLEIDYKGMLDLKNKYPSATSIYILPPNMETLKNRLKNRGEDDIAQINARIESSKNELSFCKYADFVITNDNFNEAIKQLKLIIIDKKLKFVSLDKRLNSISAT